MNPEWLTQFLMHSMTYFQLAAEVEQSMRSLEPNFSGIDWPSDVNRLPAFQRTGYRESAPA